MRMLKPVRRRSRAHAAMAIGLAALCPCACTTSTTASTAARIAPTSDSSASPSLGHAASGGIEVTGAYIPQPASPDVAVAYFTLTDTGPHADLLLSASTDPASQAMVMRDVSSGASAGTMVNVTGGLPVPAHGSVTLAPGGYHLMLTHPATRLLAGGHVTVTLLLRDTGALRVEVPVTSLTSDAQNSPMPSMSRM